jgi:hypothetical protein
MNTKTKIRSVFIIAMAWLVALSLLFLAITKMKILFHR